MADIVEVIRSPLLEGVPHGFLGRRGGVSLGTLAGLNVGHGAEDDSAAVAENRRRAIAAVLPGAQLATVYQVHSPDAVEVRAPAVLGHGRAVVFGPVTDIEAGERSQRDTSAPAEKAVGHPLEQGRADHLDDVSQGCGSPARRYRG